MAHLGLEALSSSTVTCVHSISDRLQCSPCVPACDQATVGRLQLLLHHDQTAPGCVSYLISKPFFIGNVRCKTDLPAFGLMMSTWAVSQVKEGW